MLIASVPPGFRRTVACREVSNSQAKALEQLQSGADIPVCQSAETRSAAIQTRAEMMLPLQLDRPVRLPHGLGRQECLPNGLGVWLPAVVSIKTDAVVRRLACWSIDGQF